MKKTKEFKAMERAIRLIDDSRPKEARKCLLKVMGLIEVLPERECSYTHNAHTGESKYTEQVL